MQKYSESNKERIIRLPVVKDRTGNSRSTIYANMKNGTFPQSIKLGERAVGWLESEIDALIETRAQQRQK